MPTHHKSFALKDVIRDNEMFLRHKKGNHANGITMSEFIFISGGGGEVDILGVLSTGYKQFNSTVCFPF